MNILLSFWRYWKWLCVALVTTTIVLLLAATIINHFKSAPSNNVIGQCIDNGGTWDEGEGACKFPA